MYEIFYLYKKIFERCDNLNKTDELFKLKSLHDNGTITDEEFDVLKDEIINPKKNEMELFKNIVKKFALMKSRINLKEKVKKLSVIMIYGFVIISISNIFYLMLLSSPFISIMVAIDADNTSAIIYFITICCLALFFSYKILKENEKHRRKIRFLINTFYVMFIGGPLFAITGGLIIFILFQKIVFKLEYSFFRKFDKKYPSHINSQMDAVQALEIFKNTQDIWTLKTLRDECYSIATRTKDNKMILIQRACILKKYVIKTRLKFKENTLEQETKKYRENSKELSKIMMEFQTW